MQDVALEPGTNVGLADGYGVADLVADSLAPPQDVAVAPYMAGLLHEAAGGAASGEGSRLVMFPHAGHVQSALSDPDRYYDELVTFVSPLVGDPAPARRLTADEADAGE